jgi:hypothetical protein
MASNTPAAAPDGPDPLLRPAWEDAPDETDIDRFGLPRQARPTAGRTGGWPDHADLPTLLGPLCVTTDALARLDARAAAAPEPDRLVACAEQARGLAAAVDKRSRLPDAIDALLRVPALTPKALAVTLGIAPQTATASLRALQGKGVVREVTGRGSFRAFAV